MNKLASTLDPLAASRLTGEPGEHTAQAYDLG